MLQIELSMRSNEYKLASSDRIIGITGFKQPKPEKTNCNVTTEFHCSEIERWTNQTHGIVQFVDRQGHEFRDLGGFWKLAKNSAEPGLIFKVNMRELDGVTKKQIAAAMACKNFCIKPWSTTELSPTVFSMHYVPGSLCIRCSSGNTFLSMPQLQQMSQWSEYLAGLPQSRKLLGPYLHPAPDARTVSAEPAPALAISSAPASYEHHIDRSGVPCI